MTKSESQNHFLDASEYTLGRLASRAAVLLMGKHKPVFNYREDQGDRVTISQCARVMITGNKLADKVHYTHSSYPGGIKAKTLGERIEADPEKVVRQAISLMLPDNRLRRSYLSHLVLYAKDLPKKASKEADA